VRVAFERLGDHLFVGALLDPLDGSTIDAAFSAGGPLAFLVADETAAAEHAGELQALAVQLPERYGVELPDVVSSLPRELLLTQLTGSLVWRDPAHLNARTRQLLREALRVPGQSGAVFSALMSVATTPSAVDAFWLDEVLRGHAFPRRDGYWCGHLHLSFQDGGVVANMIQQAFEVDAGAVPEDVAERWAVVLTWCFAAADRRVRDGATKALVRLAQAHPGLCAELIERFADIDDPYVFERILLAAYGALLRVRNREAEQAVAEQIWLAWSEDAARYRHALIRDHARCLLELAAHDSVLPAGASTVLPLPPDEWPLTIPDLTTLEPFRDIGPGTRQLYRSCLQDDFYIYGLSWFHQYKHLLNKGECARWIFNRTLELGYTEKKLAPYDLWMMQEFGSGRGKPDWAERIGKKLQWIARAELAARLTDHAAPSPNEYRPPHRADVSPLSMPDERDLDPSVLRRDGNEFWRNAEAYAWWAPRVYDFSAARVESDETWLDHVDDLPFGPDDLRATDSEGQPWILLNTYMRRQEEYDDGQPHRVVELWLRSYLVEAEHLESAFTWLSGRSFFSGWLPDGEDWHSGFLGEYPWATTFNEYDPEDLRSQKLDRARSPTRFTPTTASLSDNPEYDAFQQGTLTLRLPARAFFREELNWDGDAGYVQGGRQVFLDPSVSQVGPPALLISEPHLSRFLERYGLAVVWGLFGEKVIGGPDPTRGPAVSHSRVFAWDGRVWRVAEPFYREEARQFKSVEERTAGSDGTE